MTDHAAQLARVDAELALIAGTETGWFGVVWELDWEAERVLIEREMEKTK